MDAEITVAPIVSIPMAVPQKKNTDNVENSIFDFLQFCHKNKEIEIYYLFLNEVEVKNFADGRLEIAGNNGNSLSAKIEELLKKWSSQNWKVINTKQSKIISLKEKMIEQVKNAEDYQIIKNNFPEANISDIILK